MQPEIGALVKMVGLSRRVSRDPSRECLDQNVSVLMACNCQKVSTNTGKFLLRLPDGMLQEFVHGSGLRVAVEVSSLLVDSNSEKLACR
jgi:hypothetical protein